VTGKEVEAIENVKVEFRSILKLLRSFPIAANLARVEPTPEHILARVRDIASNYEKKFREILKNGGIRIKLYQNLWKKSMELIYGKEVLKSIQDLSELYIKLTMYVTILKFLGATIIEAMLGGGRYTIPLRIYFNGYKEAVEMFWKRSVLGRFNIKLSI